MDSGVLSNSCPHFRIHTSDVRIVSCVKMPINESFDSHDDSYSSLPIDLVFEIAQRMNRGDRRGRATWQSLMISCREMRNRCSELITSLDVDEEGQIERFPRHAKLATLRFSLEFNQVISILCDIGRTKPSRLSNVNRIELDDTDDKLRGRLVDTIAHTCPSASTLIIRVASGYYHSLRITQQFFEAFKTASSIGHLSFESPFSRSLRSLEISHLIHLETLKFLHETLDHDVVQALAHLPRLKDLACDGMSLVSPLVFKIEGQVCPSWRVLRLTVKPDHQTLVHLSLSKECQIFLD